MRSISSAYVLQQLLYEFTREESRVEKRREETKKRSKMSATRRIHEYKERKKVKIDGEKRVREPLE